MISDILIFLYIINGGKSMPDIKKLISLLSAAVVAVGVSSAALAEPEPTEGGETATQATEGAAAPEAGTGVYMENPELTAPDTEHAEAALLMDMNSGRLIYGKNTDEKLYPASTTKMMTAILALESGKMGDTTTATYEALQSITLEDSHMGILIGEELTMKDLVYSMLIYSANDSANVIAVHVGGSMSAFVDMMNAKAQELGMTNTHFANPCGIQDENHYTTAADLATLALYCMKNEEFRNIVKQPIYHIDPTNKYGLNRDLPSTNLFLSTSRSSYYLYKPCTGIKTGTTEAAGHCLVASAEYKDLDLLTVVLKCDDLDVKENAYSYIVSKNLFDFGFNNYEAGVLAKTGSIVWDSKVKEAKKDKRVSLTVDTDVNALVPIGNDISAEVEPVISLPELTAPIEKGQVLGTISYMYHDTEIGKANLIAANGVEQDIFKHVFYIVLDIITNPLVFIPAILVIIIALIARSKKRRRERKKRLQQLKQRRESEESRMITGKDRISRNTERHRTSAKNSNSRYSDDRLK